MEKVSHSPLFRRLAARCTINDVVAPSATGRNPELAGECGTAVAGDAAAKEAKEDR